MTARMQTVREMAQECRVSERFMAQCLYVVKKGIPGVFHLVSSHGLNVPELTLMVDLLPSDMQEEWSRMTPEDLKAAIKTLRKSKTARMRSPILEDLHHLAAGALGIPDFLARHKGARIPNGDL